jgi:hypothetical protein
LCQYLVFELRGQHAVLNSLLLVSGAIPASFLQLLLALRRRSLSRKLLHHYLFLISPQRLCFLRDCDVIDDAIDDAIPLSIIGRHPAVALHVIVDLGLLLTGIFGHYLLHKVFYP